jgi:hypothetical protein
MITLYSEEGNGFVNLSVDDKLDVYVLHVELKSWSKSEYKRYKKVFKVIKDRLKQVGITEVFSITDSKKERKFNLMFGFKPTGMLVLDDNGILSEVLKLEVV